VFYFICIIKDTQQNINDISVLKNICEICMSASIAVLVLSLPQMFHVTKMFRGI